MQFLGRQDCIESLHKDLADLQCVTVDVFSTTGPMQIFSWKFPDKLSGNLDLDLKQYSFMHGDVEFNQHAHIVLLELVIDRLLLLLQASNVYFEQHSPIRNQPADQKEYTSIGLVVKRYWSHLLQFSNMKICNEPNIHAEMSSCNKNVADDTPLSGSPCPPFYPEVDTFDVSCQTEESSMAPCSACHESQSFMRKTGSVLVELLHGEGLPSSLHSVLVASQDGVEPTTDIDVSLWASEHVRDLRRLTKHVQDMRDTVEKVTMKLEASEARGDKLEIDIESVRKEVEKQKSTIVQLEQALQKAQASMKETEQKLSDEYRLLKTEYASLKKTYSDLSEEGAIQQKRLKDLESQRNTLQEKLKIQHIQEEAYSKLQDRMQQYASQLGEADLLLEREKAKCNSACRHLESMDTKQNSLRQRLEALDEECEQLQKRLEESEDRELNLTNQVQRMSEDNEQLRTQLASQQDVCSHLQSEKQTLQTQIDDFQSNVAELQQSLKTFKETERLLVAFPELSPLAHARPKSTGNVLLDMEKQLQANSIRIRVLKRENATLQGSLAKLKETQLDHLKEKTPLKTCRFYSAGPPLDEVHSLIQIQRSSTARQAPWSGYSNRSDRVITLDGGWTTTSLEDPVRVTPLTPQNISLQNLHLNINPTVAKSQKTSHRSVKPRKRINH